MLGTGADLAAVPRRRSLAWTTVLALAGLLVVATLFRFYDLDWDRSQHVHPDERFIVWVADSVHLPANPGDLLNPAVSPLNPFRWPPGAGDLAGQPRDYAYGHFPLYLLVLVGHAGQAGARTLSTWGAAVPDSWLHLAEYGNLSLAGRAISAVADLLSLIVVFFLARRLYGGEGDRGDDRRGTVAGLLAAAAYALAVLPIQLSHFYAVDLVLTFLVLASVAVAARAAEAGGWPAWIAAGALAGLAVGTKFSAVVIAVPLAVAAFYRLPEGGRARVVARRLIVALLAGVATFFLTNPFALVETRAYLRNIMVQNAMVTGAIDVPYMRQFAGTLPYWYWVQQLSQWGLGWPLGLTAWAGFTWQIIRAGRGRATPGQTVAVAWALTYFAVTGPLFAKFLRYAAPLLPFMLVFAAGGALALRDWLQARWARRGLTVWAAALACVALFTIGWVLAFTGIYRQEHTWIQASRWIYQNVPAESKLLTEHWDDALPLALDELPDHPAKRPYQQFELPLYDPDNTQKLDLLAQQLSGADYVILASDRLAGPIQRLPARYPMTSQYYRLLFDGGLGYTPAAEFTGYPRLGGLVIPDDHADESFSVYDHPHVRIFANTGHLSSERIRTRLARYLPLQTGQVRGVPGLAMMRPAHSPFTIHQSALQLSPPPPPLTLSQPVDTLPVVADFRWNSLATRSPPLAATLWWLAIGVFGWAAWPLLFPLLGGLRDRGYSLARLAGWLMVGWVVWLGASIGLWQYRTPVVAAFLALLILAGGSAWYVQRRAIAAYVASRRRLIVACEAVFLTAFLAGVGLRLLNPDLWQPWNGGEKFMEFAFLNATLRSASFPPYDPFYAGGFINYYYYGLYLVSLLVKLTGIAPEVAFNLAVPGLFGLTALALFGAGASLAGERRRAVLTGLLAILLALLLGNLSSFQQLTDRLAQVGGQAPGTSGLASLAYMSRGLVALARGAQWPGFDYWAASRVIPNTINEFPFWSFLFADLHPHLIAMPVGVAVAGLALNWVLLNERAMPKLAPSGGPLAVPAQAPDGPVVVAEPEETPEVPDTIWSGPATSGPSGGEDAEMLVSRGTVDGENLLPQSSTLSKPPVAAWSGEEAAGTLQDLPASGAPGVAGIPLVPAEGPNGDGVATARPASNMAAPPWRLVAANVALLVIMLGALGPTNTWDLPVYFLLVAGAFWLAAWRGRRVASALEAVFLAALTGILAALAYAPFYMHYEALVGGHSGTFLTRYMGLVHGDSPLQPWLLIWGFYLFLAYSFTLWAIFTGTRRPSRAVVLLLVAAGIALVLFMLDRPNAALAALPLVLALGLAFRRSLSARDGFMALLLALGLGIVAGIELVYLRDFLEGGDWYRMNTLFKFAMPAWLVLGLAGAVMLPRLWDRVERAAPALGPAWRALAVALLIAGLVFIPFGIQARVDDRFPGPRPAIGTLDGTAYMTVGRYTWPNDARTISLANEYSAIHWLLDNVRGSPVIAEAPAGEYQVDGQPAGYDYYRAGGLRVASLTGFPTLVGQHEYEQRPGDQVGERTQIGQELFRTLDPGRARAIIDQLHVDYVYIGTLERVLFTPQMLAKFGQLANQGVLQVAYANPDVTIYRVASR